MRSALSYKNLNQFQQILFVRKILQQSSNKQNRQKLSSQKMSNKEASNKTQQQATIRHVTKPSKVMSTLQPASRKVNSVALKNQKQEEMNQEGSHQFHNNLNHYEQQLQTSSSSILKSNMASINKGTTANGNRMNQQQLQQLDTMAGAGPNIKPPQTSTSSSAMMLQQKNTNATNASITNKRITSYGQPQNAPQRFGGSNQNQTSRTTAMPSTLQQPTGTSQSNLDQSYRQMRAQSRRNVPQHYFHPVAATLAGSSDANSIMDGALESIANQQSPPSKQMTRNDQDELFANKGGFVLMAAQQAPLQHPQPVQTYITLDSSQAPRTTTKIISRDSIQPPGSKPSVGGQRQGSTAKRRSVLHQAPQGMQQQATSVNKKTSRNIQKETIESGPGTEIAAPLHIQKRIREQQLQTLNMLGSIESQATSSMQRKNSSLSRRDQQQMYHNNNKNNHPNQATMFQSSSMVTNNKRRKSSSNPRQKIGSNMRAATLQVQPSAGQQYHHGQSSRIRVQRSNRGVGGNATGPKIGQKYGYKYAGHGPIEAYSTTSNTEAANQTGQGFQPQPQQMIFTSIEANNAGQGYSKPLASMSKKLSANQLMVAPTIQISQDINPMNLQHLSSIDRAGSIDSACYDFQASANLMKGGFLSVTNPVSSGLTPKTVTQAAGLTAGNGGFSEMLKQTIFGTKDQDLELEAVLLSLDQSQHQNQSNIVDMRKSSLPPAQYNTTSASVTTAGQQNLNQPNTNPRLESLIQQLIVRKEITQSPNIQQRRPYNTGQITAAHHSLQAAHHGAPPVAHQVGPMPQRTATLTNVGVSNFAASSLGDIVLLKHLPTTNSQIQGQQLQQQSAEDLLRIGGGQGNQSCSPQKRPPQNQQQQIFQTRVTTPQTVVPQQQAQQSLTAAASFGQISQNHLVLVDDNTPGEGKAAQASVNAAPSAQTTEKIVLSMSDTFGFPHNQTQPIKGTTGHQSVSQASDQVMAVHRQKFLSLDQPQLPNVTKTKQGGGVVALDDSSCIEDVYHRTLSAYQNDINQLQEINRRGREVSDRIAKHQNLLQSIQGVNIANNVVAGTTGSQIAPSSASAVLIDSVANNSTIIQGGQSASNQQQALRQQQLQQSSNLNNVLMSLQHQQQIMLEQPLAMSQAIPGVQLIQYQSQPHQNHLPGNMTTGSSLTYNTGSGTGPADLHHQSHRNSFIDIDTNKNSSTLVPGSESGTRGIIIQHNLGGNMMSLESNQAPNKQQNSSNMTTSPIVGRYRLKNQHSLAAGGSGAVQSFHHPGASGAGTVHPQHSSKRQMAYDQASMRTTITAGRTEKRTKSVRPRRSTHVVGGSNNMRGGGRRGGQQGTGTGTGIRNKFDSIAQAYHSTTTAVSSGAAGRGAGDPQNPHNHNNVYNNTTHSQRSFVGGILGSTAMTALADISPSEQQYHHTQTAGAKQQSSVSSYQAGSGGLLQQTYGVPQKLNSTAGSQGQQPQNYQQLMNGKRSTAVGSVPKQRQGAGFSSNLRPPIKQTERSLSHNRNRAAQHSFNNSTNGAKQNSFVAQHTYLSVGSGSIQAAQNQTQGQSTSYIPISANYDHDVNTGSFEIQSAAISPQFHQHQQIQVQNGRSFKYQRSNTRATSGTGTGLNKTVGRAKASGGKQQQSQRTGRPIVVANSTQQLVGASGPISRKQSRIVSVCGGAYQAQPNANGRNAPSEPLKKVQLSQQQVYEVRASLLQNNVVEQQEQEDEIEQPQQAFTQDHLEDSGLDKVRGIECSPPITKTASSSKPTIHLVNKITPNTTNQKPDNEVSVGGQEITGQPFMRTHNLRYSSAVNDFSSYHQNHQQQQNQQQKFDNDLDEPVVLQEGSSAEKVANETFEEVRSRQQRSQVNRSELSQETQERQNQAMKLINEDNPFENPASQSITNDIKKELQPMPHSQPQQIMSFTSTAEKTNTERESKNTAGGFGQSFSKQQSTASARRQIFQANGATSTAMMGRRSLLGITAMRRSETTEDSQQCKYINGSLIMSSLPMPMHSIKQVIAEEEAAEEQDERTTNKEESKGANGPAKNGGGTSSKHKTPSGGNNNGQRSATLLNDDDDGPNMVMTDGSDSSSLRRKLDIGDNSTCGANKVDAVSTTSHQAQAKEENDKRETPAASANVVVAPSGMPPKQIPTDPKQSQRYSSNREMSGSDTKNAIAIDIDLADDEEKEDEQNILCESSIAGQSCSVQIVDDSGVNIMDTPDILANKAVVNQATTDSHNQRKSYNRGAFQRFDDKLLQKQDGLGGGGDWPPQLSESSYRNSRRRHKEHSDDESDSVHSDDEVEVRRGLESEHQRTDMGNNPELLRQSTHSLLHKNPTNSNTKDANKGRASDSCMADMLVLKRPTLHCDESNDNLISDEIIEINQIQHSRENVHSTKNSLTVAAARNNNYFQENNNSSTHKMENQNKSNKENGLVEQDEEDIEDEDCGAIVGGVHDAEEFKFGKVTLN